MINELYNTMVHPSFKDGQLSFSTYVSDGCGGEDTEALIKIAEEMLDEDIGEVGIACHFTATSLLDDKELMGEWGTGAAYAM